jgi:spore coat polysaccharide biosynthesis protein SpsF
MRSGIVLQARMASQRLPGKVMETLAGRPLIEQCLLRLVAAETAPVFLATTTRIEDDVLAAVAERLGVPVFRGPVEDVLSRFVRCAETFQLDLVIRATADNPAVDIESPGRLLSALLRTNADYVGEQPLPYGAGVEAMTRDALNREALLARDAFDREHVTTYARRHQDQFKIVTLEAPAALARPDVRLTVDTPNDLQRMRQLYARVGDGLHPVIDFIRAWDHLERRSVA